MGTENTVSDKIYDMLIIGNGPAGLAAAIYAVRAGLNSAVIAESPVDGGQITTTYEVDNYPGLPGIGGMELGMKFREHADKLGVKFIDGHVNELNDKGSVKSLLCEDGQSYEARTVVLAMGADHSKLGVPGEKELTGAGVSYCATCDGAFYRKKTVAVVGGGDVALEDSIFLSNMASKVYLIHRRDAFRGAQILVDEVRTHDNIEILYDTVVESVAGDDKVDHLEIKNVKTGDKDQLKVDGVFMAVGIVPNLNGINGLPEQDEKGFIVAPETCETSIPGVYAAGDIRTKQLRQVITAAADGANAVTSAQKFLKL